MLDHLREALAARVRRLFGSQPATIESDGEQANSRAIELIDRYERTGRRRLLEKALANFREAVAAAAADDPALGGYLSNLGLALRHRYERMGRLADLDEAIDFSRQAVEATPVGHHGRAARRSNLAGTLATRFERTGQAADLDEAIDISRQAVEATPVGHPNRGGRLSNLGAALRTRFDQTGQAADLDEAIEISRQAVEVTPAGHPYRGGRLSNLGVALQHRFAQTGQAGDLDEAIDTGQRAVTATLAGDPERAGYLSNLGAALMTRFERAGRRDDADDAIQAYRQAVQATPNDHSARGARLSGLAAALQRLYRNTGQLAYLDQSISTDRQALEATPAGHANRAVFLLNLGHALALRAGHARQTSDLDEAIQSWRDAVGVTSAPPGIRIEAAHAWGQSAASARNFTSAADGFAMAVRLLPQLVWHGLDQATREKHLASWKGLAADAAACAVRAGHPDSAVELLEHGRSVMWTQLLNMRTDLSRLAEQEPDLAARLSQIRAVLDAPPPVLTLLAPHAATTDGGTVADGTAGWVRSGQAQLRDERIRQAQEWDQVLARVRKVDGFGHFLEPTPLPELRPAAAGGPVVIVNASSYGCDALVVTDRHPVKVIELSKLTNEDSIARAGILLALLRRASGAQAALDRERDRHAMLDLLDWLWDTIADPVLTVLGCTSPPRSPWPRLWWCPTGPLTLLPLHAAGHHQRHRRADQPAGLSNCVLDRVISSYTPTLASLLRAQQKTGGTTTARQLAIGVPVAAGHPPLHGVDDELRVLARHFPPPAGVQLQGKNATWAAVNTSLPSYPWVHLACHASQDMTDPGRSAFALWDGPLAISDLTRARDGDNLVDRELAYLSACQTAAGDVQLIDEAIHLAAALQLLGYRHVIAAMWSIADQLAPGVTDAIYTAMSAAGHLDTELAAEALHHAIVELRANQPTEPNVWAPYIHTGP